MGLAKAVLIVQLSLFLLTSLTVFAQILPEALPPHYHAISPVMPPAHPPSHHHHHPHPPTPSPTKPPTYAPPTKPPAHPPSHHHHHPHPPTPSPTKPPTYAPPPKPLMPPAHPPSHHHHHPHPHPPTPSPTKPPTYAPPPKPPTYAPPPKPVQPPSKPPTKPPTYSPPPKTPTKPPTYAPPPKAPVKPPTYAPPPTKPPVHAPTYPPPPPAAAKPPAYPKPTRSFVAVQGVVFCKSCKYNGSDTLLGATPILGATVKITCKNTKYKQEATGKTDKNGYFFLQAPKTVTSFGAHKCTVSLVSSPLKTCTKPSNLHGGLKGATLRPEKPFTANKLPFMLYTVGPLAFEPKCY